MKEPFKNLNREIPRVDSWVPDEEDMVFKHIKGAIYVKIDHLLGIQNENLNYFIIASRRCYNDEKVRAHIVQYLNYFEKFYDPDKELLMIYAKIKYLIDFEPMYNKDAFFNDIFNYLLSVSIRSKICSMNNDNYYLNISKSVTKTKENLIYDNNHGMLLMELSLMSIMIIPLLVHFTDVKRLTEQGKYIILSMYDRLLSLFSVDLYQKLYETANTNILQNKENHPIWDQQDIRGINTTTHSQEAVETILIYMVPKYVYNENAAIFNYRCIIRGTQYKVTHIGYEMDFSPASSTNRDAEDNSDFDKFEAYMAKKDEALFIQSTTNGEYTMKHLELQFGPFDQKEIDYYTQRLSKEGYRFEFNPFQKELVFNLFYKYFGDTKSPDSINRNDYIKLIIAGKRMLQASGMKIMPYILSSKILKLVEKKAPNKDTLTMLMASPYYAHVERKYRNEKIILRIFSQLATIIASEFEIVDYENKNIDNKIIPMDVATIREEFLLYILMI